MHAHERRSARAQGILRFAALAPFVLFMACNAILGIGEPQDPAETGGASGTSNNGGSAASSVGGSSGSGAGTRSTTGASGGESGGTDSGGGGSGGADAGSGGVGGEDGGNGGVGGPDAGDGGVGGVSGVGGSGGAGAGNGGIGGAGAGSGPGGTRPIVVEVTSAADTTIQSNFNYQGDELVCKARSDIESAVGSGMACLMRWDLSSIPPGSSVGFVALEVEVKNPSHLPIFAYPLRANWSERTASWSVRVVGAPWEVTGAIGPLDRGDPVGTILFYDFGRYTVPLESQWIALVQSWVDAPSTNFGISFSSPDNDNGIFIATREELTEYQPRLVVSYLPPLAR